MLFYEYILFSIILSDVVIQVGTVLLGCAFLYDIFWVFVSKKLFHESVMIVVSNPLNMAIWPL